MTALALSMPDRRRLLAMSIPFLAVVGSMVIGLLLIAASGKSVPDSIEAFLDGAFGTAFAVGASINRAVSLSLIGLGFILAARANLTNVGGEGQIAVGGIAATALALWPPIAGLPLGLAVILPLLAGTLAGAVWGGIAGVMKVRFGTIAACLLFGAATALQFQLPAMGINVPTAFLLMLPYLLALLAVAGVVGRLDPPTALTLPFQRGK